LNPATACSILVDPDEGREMIVNSNSVLSLFTQVNSLIQQKFTVTKLWTEYRLLTQNNFRRYILFYFADLQPAIVPPTKLEFSFGPVTDQVVPDIILSET
jgi:hypothetical protein